MSLGSRLMPLIPFLRRYARAISGDQAAGDAMVRATIAAIADDPERFPQGVDARLGLYRAFHDTLEAGFAATDGGAAPDAERIAQARLARISPRSRMALLLTAMEGFSTSDAAFLLDCDVAHVEALVREALDEVARQTQADVLIIEDEPMIAMDLEAIVRDMGHTVTAVAMTRNEAVAAANEKRPGLVLADIQLADDSSGIDAVTDILTRFSVPAIFITAFPERLLTGARLEPTYLITKPFQRATVMAAIAQALFFDQQTIPAG